ncbi:tetratricopeptide repeat protein [Chloroflexus sp. MS-CIW-1]|uniref:tetratricopeptide repeat protein n=1 Tax=Chloroflexus sp. MS-CIW-1 TaxID=3055768 RepID=UPI0026484076|nr:tetratricopeptide repeat protein [Chloroflexus sp. MS-CIW-1]MDN5271831.1 tetratricopeptide repeat protein [Chloroflexus sp. MS-CIW-1]
MSEHELERYTGAWATPDLVGREAILKQIDTAISSTSGASIIALYGKGGIGKTRILNDTFKRRKPGLFLAQQVVDLYDMQYHSSLALASAIYASLNVANSGHFRTFEEKRAQQYKAQISGDVRAIAEATQETLQAFITDFNRFSQSQHVVIALDTVERIAYGATEQRPPFQVAAAWQWLIETLPHWGNVTVLVAGRNQIRHLFPDLENHPAIRLTRIEVEPFTPKETNEYLDAVARAAEQAGEQAVADTLRDLKPQDRERVYRYSGGAPIMLALLADYISISGFGQIPDILDVDTDPARAQEELEQQIVNRMMSTKGIKDVLLALGRAPKGVDRQLLKTLLHKPDGEVLSHLEAISRLSFIKVRDRRYFLHDEMYAILRRQIYNQPGDDRDAGDVNRNILQWYRAQIDECNKQLNDLYTPIEQENHSVEEAPHLDHERIARITSVQQEKHRLMVELMYYTLRYKPYDGFREYFNLSSYATSTGNTMLDIQLQAELLAFLDERDPSGQQPYIDGLEREVVVGVTKISPVVRLYGEGNYLAVIREAQRLRQQNIDQIIKAALNIWEALAMTERGTEEEQSPERIKSLLDDAEQILSDVDKSANVSETRELLVNSLLALVHQVRGFGLRFRGQVHQAIKEYRRAATRWRRVKMPVYLASILNNLGFAESEEGSFTDGQRLVEESLKIRKELGDWVLIGLSYATLSLVLINAGNHKLAQANAERALRLFRAVGYLMGQGIALRNLAEVLRRSAKHHDDLNQRIQCLRKAIQYAQEAYEIFGEIGSSLRRIEPLIEKGDALRRLIAIKCGHPSLLEEDRGALLDQSVETLESAIRLARDQRNSFRQVVAGVNMAYAGFHGERPDIIEKGLREAREAIPSNYLITGERLPNSQDPNIYHPQVFNELARIHMLIGHHLFAHYRRNRSEENLKDNLKRIEDEHLRLAKLFVEDSKVDFRTVDDSLRYAIHYYALAFEYDRVFMGSDPHYTLSDPGGLRGQNSVYNRLKDLSAKELDIVAQAVRTFEQDYPVRGKRSAMRDLLERCALLIE